jgi:hypothetical protein
MNQKPNYIKRLQALMKQAEEDAATAVSKRAGEDLNYPQSAVRHAYENGQRDAYRNAIMLLQGHKV